METPRRRSRLPSGNCIWRKSGKKDPINPQLKPTWCVVGIKGGGREGGRKRDSFSSSSSYFSSFLASFFFLTYLYPLTSISSPCSRLPSILLSFPSRLPPPSLQTLLHQSEHRNGADASMPLVDSAVRLNGDCLLAVLICEWLGLCRRRKYSDTQNKNLFTF